MQREFSNDIGPTFLDGETCEHSRQAAIGASTLSAVASHVRTYRRQGVRPESKASEADCGESLRESFAEFDHDSSSWKTRQRSLFAEWVEFSATWPRTGLMLNGKCFRRADSEPHICGSECSSLPTLTKVACEHPGRQRIKEGQQDCTSAALSRRDGWPPGGQMSRSHAAWMMGFPDLWTDLDHTETPYAPQSQNGSDGD